MLLIAHFLIGLKKLVSTLLSSLGDFAIVASFLVYIFLLFAIFGLHYYSGVYKNSIYQSSTKEVG